MPVEIRFLGTQPRAGIDVADYVFRVDEDGEYRDLAVGVPAICWNLVGQPPLPSKTRIEMAEAWLRFQLDTQKPLQGIPDLPCNVADSWRGRNQFP